MFEAGMVMSLEKGGAASRTSMRAWKEGHYILVDLPGGVWAVPSEDEIIARVVGHGMYMGFTTGYLGVLREFNILVLKYPGDIMETPFESEKYSVSLPAQVTSGEGGEEGRGVITSVSEDGCVFVTGAQMREGKAVMLRVNLPTAPGGVSLKGVIEKADQWSGQRVCDMKFETLDRESKKHITEFLKATREYKLGQSVT